MPPNTPQKANNIVNWPFRSHNLQQIKMFLKNCLIFMYYHCHCLFTTVGQMMVKLNAPASSQSSIHGILTAVNCHN